MSTITIDAPVEVEAPAEVTASDLLWRAADILEEFDWRQGSKGSRAEGSMCAIGAIYEAVLDCGDESSLRAALVAFEKPEQQCAIIPLATWNDARGRTKAEVVAKLRELAAM